MKLINYTRTTGRIYANGVWIGNFYTDSQGIIRDTVTGREVCA